MLCGGKYAHKFAPALPTSRIDGFERHFQSTAQLQYPSGSVLLKLSAGPFSRSVS
jgi:hypothetical protein